MPLPIKNSFLRILIQLAGWGIMALLPIYCLGMIEYIHYANKAMVFTFFLERGAVVLFDLAVLYLLWIAIVCLIQKGWIATLLFGGLSAVAAYSNYMKHAMTGDYLYPWDIAQQAGNVGKLLHFITVPFPILYLLLILFIPVMTVLVWLSGARLPLRWFVRVPVTVIIAICMATSVSTPNKITGLLNRNSLYLEDMMLQTYNYTTNGFVGAFTVNLLSSNVQHPDGYSRESIEALLADCHGKDADASFSSPDIILILSESFWDPTALPGTTFSFDPLAGYRALCEEENTVSGRFFTTGFGGGTVRPEFEVLTGLTTDRLPSGCVPWQYITKPTESYISLYRDLGYQTIAVHPYTASFYCLRSAYPLIGIDALHFEEDIYALGKKGVFPVYIEGNQISDASFACAIEYYMEQNTDAPTLLFGISMENHQPYPNKYDREEITVVNPAINEDVMNAVRNFAQGVSHEDACLVKLAEFVKNRDRDTVLVWFGDHLPTLGANSAAYVQSGMIGAYDEADYEKMYSTPFLIYANFDLQDSTLLRKGKDNNVISYQLMNGVSELIGAPSTPLMAYLKKYAEAIPYYNVRLQKKISGLPKEMADGHAALTYDRTVGGRYSLAN